MKFVAKFSSRHTFSSRRNIKSLCCAQFRALEHHHNSIAPEIFPFSEVTQRRKFEDPSSPLTRDKSRLTRFCRVSCILNVNKMFCYCRPVS